MNTVYAAADAKKITALVELDISAAFDTINHDVLASRLESQFGVVGAASSWLQSYIHGRQQFVRLGRHLSPMTTCDCGITQGSVLGSLLFTAYVSAVGELIESYGLSYYQFVDDMQLLVSMDSTNATPAIDWLAHCSTTVHLWFLQNGLQLNADKSEVVLLGSPAQLW